MPETSESVERLMTQAASGDAEAFGRVCDSMQDELFRLALAGLLRRTDAEEATQEVLYRAWKARKRYRPGHRVRPWLRGILWNVIRETRRQRRHAPLKPEIPAAAETPRPQELTQLAAAIERLPDRQREVVVCRYLRRMSVRETAEALGIAEGTVKAACSAGLDNLRRTINRHD